MSGVQQTVAKVVRDPHVGERIAPTDMVAASAALRAARRQRGEALAAISTGLLSVAELFELAASEDGAALRRIRIAAVLAELGCTKRRVEELLIVLRRLAHIDPTTPERRLTIGWICDRRAGSRRRTALCEILVHLAGEDGMRPPPAAGYPYRGVAVAPDLRR